MTYKTVKKLLAHWGLENEQITDMYYEGLKDKNDRAFYIGEDYVLQTATHIGGIKNHIEVAKSLEQQGLLAPVALPTQKGEEYIKEGELFIAITKRMKGQQVKASVFYGENGEKRAYEHGRIIGQLHKVLSGCEEVICNEENMFRTVSKWALPETRKYLSIQEDFENEYIERFKELYEVLPKQIIHRNPHPGNIILQEEKFVGFMNFELSERSIRIFDPCYAATAILADCFNMNNENKYEHWLEVYRQIVKGYEEVVGLSKEEKQALPYVLISIQMIFVAYCHGQQNLEELARTNEKILTWMIESKDRLAIE